MAGPAVHVTSVTPPLEKKTCSPGNISTPSPHPFIGSNFTQTVILGENYCVMLKACFWKGVRNSQADDRHREVFLARQKEKKNEHQVPVFIFGSFASNLH